MITGINAWVFDPDTSLTQQFSQTASAGFQAIELCFDTGELSMSTSQPDCELFARQAAGAGLIVTSVATGAYWQCNFGSNDAEIRQQAHEMTLAAMDRAAWLGAEVVLIVPAVVGRWNRPEPQVPYEDALNRTYEGLQRLIPDAESRGVGLAMENVWNRFLLSPIELRELIDRLNSPYVGVHFDVGNVMPFGYPEDWIRILGHRILRVHLKDYDLSKPGTDGFVTLGDGDVNWAAVFGALIRAGYDGPVLYEGKGGLSEIHDRMKRVMAQP